MESENTAYIPGFFFFFIHFVTLGGAELNLRFFSKNFLVKL